MHDSNVSSLGLHFIFGVGTGVVIFTIVTGVIVLLATSPPSVKQHHTVQEISIASVTFEDSLPPKTPPIEAPKQEAALPTDAVGCINVRDRRVVFVVSPDRSSTGYLAQILNTSPDVHAEHEQSPVLAGNHIAAIAARGLGATYNQRMQAKNTVAWATKDGRLAIRTKSLQ